MSMESIFLALSGVILMAGVLYWFWSHIQLTQKKVQLLENAVFELRGMLQKGPDHSPGLQADPISGPAAAPSPIHEPAPSIYNDLSDDDWKEDVSADAVPHASTPLESLEKPVEVSADLQPGGRIEGIESEAPAAAAAPPEQFRDLFVKSTVNDPTSLDAMPVKDLRRLAEQRGIPNVSDLRKKEILSALKSQIVAPAAAAAAVPVEKTLDLTEVAEILE